MCGHSMHARLEPAVFTHTPPSMHSHIETSAFASMIIVTLPFPALPVMCTAEEHSTATHASGHDILSSAIVCMAMGAGSAPAHVQTRKEHILLALNETLAGLWSEFLATDAGVAADSDEDVISRCYLVYCSSFREYMRCYPGSPDLRIMDIQDVDIDSTVHAQCVAHLQARASMFGDEGGAPGARVGYRGLLRAYVESMYAESRYAPP